MPNRFIAFQRSYFPNPIAAPWSEFVVMLLRPSGFSNALDDSTGKTVVIQDDEQCTVNFGAVAADEQVNDSTAGAVVTVPAATETKFDSGGTFDMPLFGEVPVTWVDFTASVAGMILTAGAAGGVPIPVTPLFMELRKVHLSNLFAYIPLGGGTVSWIAHFDGRDWDGGIAYVGLYLLPPNIAANYNTWPGNFDTLAAHGAIPVAINQSRSRARRGVQPFSSGVPAVPSQARWIYGASSGPVRVPRGWALAAAMGTYNSNAQFARGAINLAGVAES